jgi:hypothetical protein
VISYELEETLLLQHAIEASCRPKTASFLLDLLAKAIKAERDNLRPPVMVPSTWSDDLVYTDMSSIATSGTPRP